MKMNFINTKQRAKLNQQNLTFLLVNHSSCDSERINPELLSTARLIVKHPSMIAST